MFPGPFEFKKGGPRHAQIIAMIVTMHFYVEKRGRFSGRGTRTTLDCSVFKGKGKSGMNDRGMVALDGMGYRAW